MDSLNDLKNKDKSDINELLSATQDGNKEKTNYWYYKFINSDIFKQVASGMDPVLALNQVYFEQKKKKYIEAQKELQETERANKNDSGFIY
jgi:hypothetical protein